MQHWAKHEGHKNRRDSSLMVRERESAHSSLEKFGIIRILVDWAEVEHPVVFAMPVFQEPFGILPSVAVPAFDPGSWVSHDDYLVGKVYQICDEQL